VYETEGLFIYHATFGVYSNLANTGSAILSFVSPVISDDTVTRLRPVSRNSQHCSCHQGLIRNEIFASRDKGVVTKYAYSLISTVLCYLNASGA
jgi:hypothetical protein